MIALSPPEVLKALIEQGGPSYVAAKGCMYRGEDGRKCAAGLCITDSEYDVRMEHSPIDDVIIEFNLTFDGDLRELSRMQDAHDQTASFVQTDPTLSWEKTLRFHWSLVGLEAGS